MMLNRQKSWLARAMVALVLAAVLADLSTASVSAADPFTCDPPPEACDPLTNEPPNTLDRLIAPGPQSESSIAVHPTNPSLLLNANNTAPGNPGVDVWLSTNNGVTWTETLHDIGTYDPAVAIDRNGRLFVNYIRDDEEFKGQGISWRTDDPSASWQHVEIAPAPDTVGPDCDPNFPGSHQLLLDKNHLAVDNNVAGHTGNLYVAWTKYVGTKCLSPFEIEFSRSTDRGATWSTPPQVISAGLVTSAGTNQGANIQVGPEGNVYVTWAMFDGQQGGISASGIGFTVSHDRGATFDPATKIMAIQGIGATPLNNNDPTESEKMMPHRSFPSMAVDRQTGDIYIVWANDGYPDPGPDPAPDCAGSMDPPDEDGPNIYVIKSTDGGVTWNCPIRVDMSTKGDQWLPWITSDPITGNLAVVFYDSRECIGTKSAVTYVAVSEDQGATWNDFRVSDCEWEVDVGTRLDYIGITGYNNRFFPVWADGRDGVVKTYVSPFKLPLP